MASPARSPLSPLSQSSSQSSHIQELQESFQDTLRHFKSRVRSISMTGSQASPGAIADLSVKVGSSWGIVGGGEHTSRFAYHKSQPSGGVSTWLVKMGNSTAAVANTGFRPSSNGSPDHTAVGVFLRQLGLYLVQDEEDRKSISFCEDSELEHVGDDEFKSLHPSLQAESSDTTLMEEGIPTEDEDPFHYELSDDTVSIASGVDSDTVTKNTFNIEVYSRETEQLKMRALMDTGAFVNLMREGLAIKTGYPIHRIPQNARPLVVANGHEMRPEEYIDLSWYFTDRRFSNARSYRIRFLVCPDSSPYDVVLGFNFIKNEKLLKWNSVLAGVIVPQDQQRKEQQKREEAWRRKVEEEKRRQREKERQARERAREAKKKRPGQT